MRRTLAVAAALIALHGGDALAARRVALVIGNSDYANVSALSNPANDAEAVGEGEPSYPVNLGKCAEGG